MNNPRLLTGLLAAALLSGGAEACAQSVVTLQEIFEAAEAHSKQLQPSFTAVEEAQHAESVARARRLPDIQASLSASYIGDGFTTKRDLSDYQKAPIPHLGTGLSLSLTQPLYTGGAVAGSIALAGLEADAARHSADLSRDGLRFRLTGFYLDLYKHANLRQVVESNLDAARKVLAQMRARHEQGTVLPNDITRYELLTSDLELQLVRIDNTLGILNEQLVTTAGLPEGTAVTPDSTLLLRALPTEDGQWWQQEALSHAPTLSLARTGVDISLKAEKLARAERLPKVGLQAGWTIDGPILVEVPPIDRNLSYWYVGVGVSYNIGSLYKTNRTLARTRTATLRARQELEATHEQLRLAVSADHVRYLEAYEELKTRQKGAELAARNYHTVSTRYAAGMALITDLLDAANARLAADEQLVNARIGILYQYYKLLFTTGKI